MRRKAQPRAGEVLISDFTVRLYRGDDGHRLEVMGNRSGARCSVPTGSGLQFYFNLCRALKQLGAYGNLHQDHE